MSPSLAPALFKTRSSAPSLAPLTALLLALAPSCVGPGDLASPHRLEVVAARRNPESGLERTDDDQGLFGLNYVQSFEGSDLALDLGVRGGEFERVDGSDTSYFETHAGARWRFAGTRHVVQPYLGLGILWNGRGSTSKRFDSDRYDDDQEDNFFVWIFAQSSPYASLGFDVVLGAVTLGLGVRAVCGDGVDLSARHPDDFALDVFATLGVRF